MVYMDAKNYLHLTDTKYDAIVNDSIHPRLFAENASLHTLEYFEDARDSLYDDGLMVCWIPVYDMPLPILESIIGTFMEVFPYVTLWYPNHHHVNYFWLAVSKQPQSYSPMHIEGELKKAAVAESLEEIDIKDSHDVLAYYIADQRSLKKHLGEYQLNSDYHPYVEFSTEPVTPVSVSLRELVMNVREDTLEDYLDWSGFNEKEKEQWLIDYSKLYDATTYLLKSYTVQDPLDQMKECMKGLVILPENPGLLHSRIEAERMLYSESVKMIMSGNPNAALKLASAMLEIYSESSKAWPIRSTAMMSGGNADKALFAARKAIELGPDDSDVHFNLGGLLLATNDFSGAVASLKEALRLKPNGVSIMKLLVKALMADEKSAAYNPSEAVKFAERCCEVTAYSDIQELDLLAYAYAKAGRLNDAQNTIQKAIEMAQASGQRELSEKLKDKLLQYKSGQLN
jgi:Flp pilus assembly protein TadD